MRTHKQLILSVVSCVLSLSILTACGGGGGGGGTNGGGSASTTGYGQNPTGVTGTIEQSDAKTVEYTAPTIPEGDKMAEAVDENSSSLSTVYSDAQTEKAIAAVTNNDSFTDTETQKHGVITIEDENANVDELIADFLKDKVKDGYQLTFGYVIKTTTVQTTSAVGAYSTSVNEPATAAEVPDVVSSSSTKATKEIFVVYGYEKIQNVGTEGAGYGQNPTGENGSAEFTETDDDDNTTTQTITYKTPTLVEGKAMAAAINAKVTDYDFSTSYSAAQTQKAIKAIKNNKALYDDDITDEDIKTLTGIDYKNGEGYEFIAIESESDNLAQLFAETFILMKRNGYKADTFGYAIVTGENEDGEEVSIIVFVASVEEIENVVALDADERKQMILTAINAVRTDEGLSAISEIEILSDRAEDICNNENTVVSSALDNGFRYTVVENFVRDIKAGWFDESGMKETFEDLAERYDWILGADVDSIGIYTAEEKDSYIEIYLLPAISSKDTSQSTDTKNSVTVSLGMASDVACINSFISSKVEYSYSLTMKAKALEQLCENYYLKNGNVPSNPELYNLANSLSWDDNCHYIVGTLSQDTTARSNVIAWLQNIETEAKSEHEDFKFTDLGYVSATVDGEGYVFVVYNFETGE